MYSCIKQGLQVTLTLQLAKSSTIKWAGISRLELAAAYLLARLTQHNSKEVVIVVSLSLDGRRNRFVFAKQTALFMAAFRG